MYIGLHLVARRPTEVLHRDEQLEFGDLSSLRDQVQLSRVSTGNRKRRRPPKRVLPFHVWEHLSALCRSFWKSLNGLLYKTTV